MECRGGGGGGRRMEEEYCAFFGLMLDLSFGFLVFFFSRVGLAACFGQIRMSGGSVVSRGFHQPHTHKF